MKKIIAVVLAMSAVLTSFEALAAAPTIPELESQLVDNHHQGNWGKIKKLIEEDYRDVVETSDELTVNIDEGNVRALNREVLGIQYEMNDNYNLMMSGEGTFSKEFISAAERSGATPVVRIGGGSSNGVNYMYNVGPVSNRKKTPDTKLPLMGATQVGNTAMKMGPAEIIRAFQLTNPNVKVMPCISYPMNGEDANHFAHYLFDDKDESEWGAMRAADGMEEPVEVYYWELANEIDGWGAPVSATRLETYTSWAIEVVEAIKADFPEQEFIACGRTAEWSAIWRPKDDPLYRQAWNWAVTEKLAPYIEGLSYHPYYDGNPTEHMMYIADVVKEDLDKYVEENDIRDKDGNLKDMVVIATESNRWSNLTIENNDFYSAVCSAHYLNNCMERPWYEGVMFHNAISASWWCGYWLYNGGKIVLSPTAKLYKFYNEELGDRLIEAKPEITDNLFEVSKDDTSLDPEEYKPRNFSIIASPNGDYELKLFLVNRTPYSERKIKFNFKNNNYTLVEEKVFTAPNAATMAYDRASEDLTEVITTEKNEKNFSEYTMKGCNVTVLTLKSDKKIAKADGGSAGDESLDAPEADDSVFTDISGVYSKNEIAALASEGIINGKTETEFAPNDTVSNAEFATMLSRILGVKANYKGAIWKDVSKDSWYTSAANAMYVEGIMSGDYFKADKAVTVGDLMSVLGTYLINKDNIPFASITDTGYKLSPQGAYCVNKGLFQKMVTGETVDEAHLMTRAEAADVLYRFYRLVK